MDGTTLFLIRF
jgi:hypothetical protein